MAAAVIFLAGCATLATPAYSPDFYQVTAKACYRPVAVPGTQRRVAQNEAEESARRQILEYVGSMPAGAAGTLNDLMARDTHVRTQVLGVVRSAELVDWQVVPQCGEVQVWMRVDLNRIRAIAAACR